MILLIGIIKSIYIGVRTHVLSWIWFERLFLSVRPILVDMITHAISKIGKSLEKGIIFYFWK